MGENSSLLQRLKDANKEMIKKVIKEKFGYDLPLSTNKSDAYDYGHDNLIEMVNLLFDALVENIENKKSHATKT